MRLGRVLGMYQQPAVVVGTSALVKSGQHDYGLHSSIAGIMDTMAAQGVGDDYEIVVLETGAMEYLTLYDRQVPGDYGIPKAAGSVATVLRPMPLPEEIRDMTEPSRRLWNDTSWKARTGGVLDGADLDLITFVNEQAQNGRECFVVTYDEDESAPVRSLSASFQNVHLAEESLQPADRVVREVVNGAVQPLLLFPHVVGQLYGMEAGDAATHYLLTTKVPLAGRQEEIGIAIHPIENPLNIREGAAARYPLLVMDYDRVVEAMHTPEINVRLGQMNDRYQRAYRDLRKTPGSAAISMMKSRSHPFIKLAKYEWDLVWDRGKFRHLSESTKMEWLMVDAGYLSKFSRETLESVRDFRRAFPR